jgi:beta-galactosidase
LYPLLLRVWARFKKPINITENGTADANDEYRRWWIEETIVAMQRALSEGVDLRLFLLESCWTILNGPTAGGRNLDW